MTTAIQPTDSVNAQAGGSSPGGAGILRSQLSRYQTQLADWCHCPDGKTPEGQKKIADLQQKAASVEAQIKQLDDARVPQKTSPALAAGGQSAPRGHVSFAAESRLDVYA